MNDDQEDQPVDPPPAWAHLLPSPVLHKPVTCEYKRRRGRNRHWWKQPLPPPANDDPPIDLPNMEWKPLGYGRFYCRTHVVMQFYPGDCPGANKLHRWEAYRRQPEANLHLGDFVTRDEALDACLRDFQQTGAEP